MKNKDKNLLIIQNKELLERLNKGNNNKEQSNDIDGNENYLLKEEIKSLKEQIENQSQDLLKLNALEKQVSILQLENENMKQKTQNEKDDNSNNETLTNSVNLNRSVSTNINNSSSKKVKKRLSITIVKDKQDTDQTNLEKKTINKNTNEKEKVNEDKEITKNGIEEKLKDEISRLKVKYLNTEFEKETIITKYKNILKNIEQQCKKIGVKLHMDFDKI